MGSPLGVAVGLIVLEPGTCGAANGLMAGLDNSKHRAVPFTQVSD